jgi:hypothetical protein
MERVTVSVLSIIDNFMKPDKTNKLTLCVGYFCLFRMKKPGRVAGSGMSKSVAIARRALCIVESAVY